MLPAAVGATGAGARAQCARPVHFATAPHCRGLRIRKRCDRTFPGAQARSDAVLAAAMELDRRARN